MKSFFLFLSSGLLSCSAALAQVSLQTGGVQFGMPLYNYQEPGSRLNTGISLSYYNGNGLKVDEIASEVGTGWELQAGGFIERIQNGAPDDQIQKTVFTYPTSSNVYSADNYYPNGYLYSEFSPTDQVDNGGRYIGPPNGHFTLGGVYTTHYQQAFKYLADREQDYFAFKFNGRTGRFVIGKDFTVHTLGDSRLKINVVTSDLSANNIRTTISEINIVDEYGIKYTFKDLQLSELINYGTIKLVTPTVTPATIIYPGWNSSPTANTNVRKVVVGTPMGKFIVGKWYLSEIVNPLTNKKITFNYSQINVDYFANNTPQWSSTQTQPSITMLRRRGIDKRLTSIITPGFETITFNYSSTPRLDLAFSNQLNNINILYNGIKKYQYNFSYGYFVKNLIKDITASYTDDDKYWARLCLKQVQKVAAELQENPYTFSYNLSSSNPEDYVPSMFNPFSDYWGFFNNSEFGYKYFTGISYKGYTPGNEYNAAWGQQLPAKLSLTDIYDFKAPKGFIAGTIKSIKYPTGATLKFDYEPNFATNNGAQVQVGGVRVKATTLSTEFDNAKDIITKYNYTNADGSSSGWGYEIGNFSQLFTNNIVWNVGSLQTGMLPMQFGSKGGSVQSAILGFLNSSGTGIILDIIASIIQSQNQPPNPSNVTYTLFTSDNYSTAYNPLPFQYKRVEVVPQSATQNIGKTIYEFTAPSADYCLIDVPVLNFPYSMRQRYADWAYGLPSTMYVYNSSGTLIKKTVNSYICYKNYISDGKNISLKWAPKRSEYNASTNFPLPGPAIQSQFDDIANDTYQPMTGRTELVNSTTSEYSIFNGALLGATRVSNTYSSKNYQISKSATLNSKEETVENNIYYPEDYNTNSGLISALINMPNIPIATLSTVTKANGTKYQLSGSVINYGIATNGDVKAVETFNFQNAIPVINPAFNPSQVIPAGYVLDEIKSYDANGIGVQITKANNATNISSIYDYSSNAIVATVLNATKYDIAYTSFEGNPSGNWEYNLSGINNAFSITGKKCFDLSTGTITSFTPVINKGYRVSYWFKTGSTVTVSVFGTKTNTITGPTINGWTYAEFDITSAKQVDIYGTGFIDELRLYPKGALMTTYTYEPLFGITTQCDANNRIMYYEYDALSRLSLVRDQDKNILKKICYDYAGQPESCTPFGNDVLSQSFTRNNCAPSYTGGSITYTIPAGKYFGSTLVVANALAQQDINANGQNYANSNGTCIAPVAITGNTYFSYSASSGNGKITAVPGSTVTVTINASGAPGYNYSLSATISGAATTGTTYINNGSTSFTFIMPASGSVNWSASFSAPNSYGSGSIQVQ